MSGRRSIDYFIARSGEDPEMLTEIIEEEYQEQKAEIDEFEDEWGEWDDWFEEQRRKEWERLELLNE